MGNQSSYFDREEDSDSEFQVYVSKHIKKKMKISNNRKRNLNKSLFPDPISIPGIHENRNYSVLPFSIIHNILLFLANIDLISASLTCKSFFTVFHSQYFWRGYYRNYFKVEDTVKETFLKEEFVQRLVKSQDQFGCVNILPFRDNYKNRRNSSSSKRPISIKVVLVGDGVCEKTKLCITFVKNAYPEEYVPTVFENYNHTLLIDGKSVEMGIWDTSGQQTYEKLRPLSYDRADCFVIVFSLCNKASFDNVLEQWHPEVSNYNSEIPIMLVGTGAEKVMEIVNNKEKYESERSNLVRTKDIRMVMKEIGGSSYVYTSIKHNMNVKKAFDEAARVALGCK